WYPVSARAATGAGEIGLSTLPSGAETSMQRKTPALFGMSLRRAHLTLRNVFDFVNESVELIAARTCFELPLQSTFRVPLPRTVMATVSGTGSSDSPSLSM